MRVHTINRCRSESGDPAPLREVFDRYAEDVRRSEPGCLSLRVLQDVEDSATFVVIAEYEDDAAYQAHLASDHLARLRSALHPLIGDSHHKTLLRPVE